MLERAVGSAVEVDVWNGRVVGVLVPRAVVVSALIGVVALVLVGAERVEKSALRRAGDFVRIGSGVSIVVGVKRCSIRLPGEGLATDRWRYSMRNAPGRIESLFPQRGGKALGKLVRLDLNVTRRASRCIYTRISQRPIRNPESDAPWTSKTALPPAPCFPALVTPVPLEPANFSTPAMASITFLINHPEPPSIPPTPPASFPPAPEDWDGVNDGSVSVEKRVGVWVVR